MASSDLDMETIADKLKLGDDFADWLSKEKFSEEDPVLVLNFVGMDFLNAGIRDDIKKALLNNKAEETKFATVFKFKTWEDIDAAQDVMKAEIPWAFYNATNLPIGYRGENGDNVLFTTEPTILTSVIFSYSDETTKVLDLHLYPFFEIK
uniref:Uncharacterized protein n=1 Tax=Meloidogyne enterolobii TaxID=390850 RepID=A0A6V7VPV3_MELEN|nr:unnamed protein product [Meloidogyne enterolobii]